VAQNNTETLLRKVRREIRENKRLRYKRFTTTGFGAADGSSVISSELSESADFWNGSEVLVLEGDREGERAIAEDFGSATLSFLTDGNKFSGSVTNGIKCEIFEVGAWSSADLKQNIIDATNFLAGVLPKRLLQRYLDVRTLTSSASGVVTVPEDIIDTHFITINGNNAVEIPPERQSRWVQDEDVFLNRTPGDYFQYYFQGASSNGELIHFPTISATVKFHVIPYMQDFDSNGNTKFPLSLFDPVAFVAASYAFLQNEDMDFADIQMQKAQNWFTSRGVKVQLRSAQEGTN